MTLNKLSRQNRMLWLFTLFSVQSLAAIPSVENSIWEIFMAEYEWGSHVGKVKFNSGQLNSISPQAEGQIIAIGTYEQNGKNLFLHYTIVSTYAVHECQDISSKSKRSTCLQAAEKERPFSKYTCTYVNSKSHPFYSAYFKCTDGSIITSSKNRVGLGSIKSYQGIPIKRYYYVSKIQGLTCSAFTQIGDKHVRLELFSDGIVPEGVELAVLGKTIRSQGSTIGDTGEYYLVFLHTEPLYHLPVWIRRECVQASR